MERKLQDCSLQQQLEMSIKKPLPFLVCWKVNCHLLLVKADVERCPVPHIKTLKFFHVGEEKLHLNYWSRSCWRVEIPCFMQVCLSFLSSQGKRDSRFSSHSLRSSERVEYILVRKSTKETAWADEFEGKYAWLTFWSVIWILFLLHARYTSEICESGIQNTRKSGIRRM